MLDWLDIMKRAFAWAIDRHAAPTATGRASTIGPAM